MILVGGDGENMIAVVSGANAEICQGDVESVGLSRGEFVLLQHEVPLTTVEAALHAARDAGAISLLNTAPFRAEAAAFLGLADYVIANETEFDLYAGELSLAGIDREQQMRTFARGTGRTIVVTLGGEGVIAATPDQFFHIPTLSITPIDTVGAGDTFCGYLAAGLSEGLSLDDALRRAAVAGALACLKPGAQLSIPLHGEVEAAMASR